ncbi:MAG: glutamate formimidoyltransferase, partial [Sphingobacteriales bacterium]
DTQRGATVIGARDFLVAYNINLDTTSVPVANAIACDVRESGRANGAGKRISGSLKSVKAIGWFIEEYGKAQVSLNLTNLSVTPVHIAFNEVYNKAIKRGTRVTGSELIGLIPLKAMLSAGKYFLDKEGISKQATEHELIKMAISALGLDELSPFNPEERIIEYVLKNKDWQLT